MAQTVKEFVSDAYQIVSANSPTVTLPNGDNMKGIQFLNELLCYYSGTGLLITVAKQVDFVLAIGQENVTFADASYTPAADVQQGRLANLENAWLTLDRLTYPLIQEDRNTFLGSYKYDPQEGLPRFVVIYPQVDITTMRVYPSASQVYTLSVYGKFQLPVLTQNDTMSIIPGYCIRWLKLALAKEIARYKGRMQAWTADLAQDLKDAKEEMETISSVNLDIQSDQDSLLNGSWRVRAGV